MANSNKRRSVGFWAVALLFVAIIYAASFGPACLAAKHELVSHYTVWRVYRPLSVAMWDGPRWMARSIDSYARWWAGWTATFPIRSIESCNRPGESTRKYR